MASQWPRRLAGLVQWSRPSQGPYTQPGAESLTLNSKLLSALAHPQAARECPSGHGHGPIK